MYYYYFGNVADIVALGSLVDKLRDERVTNQHFCVNFLLEMRTDVNSGVKELNKIKQTSVSGGEGLVFSVFSREGLVFSVFPVFSVFSSSSVCEDVLHLHVLTTSSSDSASHQTAPPLPAKNSHQPSPCNTSSCLLLNLLLTFC